MLEREQLEQAIAALEAQRAMLGNAVVDTALSPMREKLAELKAQAIPTEQQRKQITILFADVSGFTAMSEAMDAEQVSDMMIALWQCLDAVIIAHGGTVDKHIGDAVMALWGRDEAREDDPERAIRAALDMQAALGQIQDEKLAAFRQERDMQLVMRVGLNTGPVLLGEIRPGEFTAMGDTVNLASRMENAAPVGGILITHDTYRHMRGIFDVQPQEPLRVKGKTEPVKVYVVQGVRSRTFRVTTRGVEGIETRMVGRDAELLTLQNAFRDVMENAETRVVTIVGEAGVGKSRLLYEFENWIELLPDRICYFKGRATPEMQTIPHGIIRDMFAHRFDIRESDSAATVLSKFRAGMAVVLDADRADLVGHLVGFDFSASTAVQNLLGSPSFGKLATAYLTNYVRAVANEPTVILLEDVHWADNSSLDFLGHVASAIPAARLLVVCLARPPLFERHPSWGESRDAYTRLDLEPLSRPASQALVSEILQKAENIPDDLRNLIVERAEGNPFYVEELINMLIENGVILRGEERWRVELARLADVRVPPTLTGILQARLDNLPREENMVLQRASVVGRMFWDTAVTELVGDKVKAAQVDTLLDAVGNRELVFRRERSTFEGTNEYIFKHAILRDVIYETVLIKLRSVYHKQVARWLESVAGERIGEYLSLIAGHYELAGETAKAADYMRRSGQESLQISAFRDAFNIFERALALLPAASQDRAPLTVQAGHALWCLGDYAEAGRRLEEGVSLARQHRDDASRAAALDHLGRIACSRGAFDEARARLEESLALADQVDDQARIAHVLYNLHSVDVGQGANAEGRARLVQSLALYQALGDRRGLARTLNGLGHVDMLMAEYKEAQGHLVQGLALYQELNDIRGVAIVHTNLGEIAWKQQDYATAQHHYQQALNIFREIGVQQGVAINLGNLGHMAVALGNLDAATSYYHQALEVAMAIEAIPTALDKLAGLAEVLAHTGQPERALELLGLALHHQALLDETRPVIEPILADLRAQLPPEVVEAAMERGASLELEAVVAEILGDTTKPQQN